MTFFYKMMKSPLGELKLIASNKGLMKGSLNVHWGTHESRIDGVIVGPIRSPFGERNRVTV